MKLSDWLAIGAMVVTVFIASFSAWVALERRVSAVEKGLEKGAEHMRDVQGIARQEIIAVLKEVHTLKGMHRRHVEESHRGEEDAEE